MALCGVEHTAITSSWPFLASMRQHEFGEPRQTLAGVAETGADSAFVRYNHRATEAEAVDFALQQSIEWVDQRLTFRER